MGVNTLGTVPGIAALGYDSMGLKTVGYWPPHPLPIASSSINSGTTGTASTDGGATSTYASLTTASLYVCPFNPTANISYHNVRNIHSVSTAAGTGSVTAGFVMGLYAKSATSNATTTDTVWSLMTAWQRNYRISQNSQTEFSVFSYLGSESSVSSGSTTHGTATGYTGTKAVDYHTATTNGLGVTQMITSGEYLLVHGVTQKTSSAAVWGGMNTMWNYLSESQSILQSHAPLGYSVSTAPLVGQGKLGYFTTTASTAWAVTAGSATSQTYAGHPLLPATFASSLVTGTTGADAARWAVPQFYMTNTI
jgi:hypothetical protein